MQDSFLSNALVLPRVVMFRRGPFSLFAIGMLLALNGPARASAQDGELKIAIVPFEGARGARWTRDLRDAAPSGVHVVELAQSFEAGRRLSVTIEQPEGAASLASELGVDYVVVGRTRKGGKLIQVIVFDTEGQEVRRQAISGPLSALVAVAFEGLSSPSPSTQEEAVSDPTASGASIEEAGLGATVDSSAEQGAGQDAAPAGEPQPEAPTPNAPAEGLPQDADEESSSDAKEERARRRILRLDGGFSLRSRELTVLLADGRQHEHSTVYPEVVATVELRPFATLNKPLLGGVLVRGFGTLAPFFGMLTPGGNRIAGLALAARGDLGWLFPIGAILEAGPSLGVSFDQYGLESNPYVPVTSYLSLRGAIEARVALFSDRITVSALAGYERVLTSGALATFFGENMNGNTLLAEASVSYTHPLGHSLSFEGRAVFDWSKMFQTFSGAFSGREATTGTEEHWRGLLVGGVSFR